MKLAVFFFTLFLSINAAAGTITLKEKTYPQLKGVQVFVLDPIYEKNIGLFFDEVKKKGGDTVFLRVFQNTTDRYHFMQDNRCKTGVYFKTNEACTISDLLPLASKEAHKRGIKLYAWMATRSLSFLKTPSQTEKEFRENGAAEGYGASIFSSAVRTRLIRLFEDLAENDIDGILFQDDFIMRYREGASMQAMHAYYADFGVMPSYSLFFGCKEKVNLTKVSGGCNATFPDWAEWKSEKMAEFFEELRITVLVRNPSVRFAANIYYETVMDEAAGVSWYAQSIERLLDAGFDYLAVMGYHDQIKSEMNLNFAETKDFMNRMTSSLVSKVDATERILMKLQIASWANKKSIDRGELAEICRMVDSHGSISKAIVPVNNASDIPNACF